MEGAGGVHAMKYWDPVRWITEIESIQISLERDLRVFIQPGDVELVLGAVPKILHPALAGFVGLVVPDGDYGGESLQNYFVGKNVSLHCNSR